MSLREEFLKLESKDEFLKKREKFRNLKFDKELPAYSMLRLKKKGE